MRLFPIVALGGLLFSTPAADALGSLLAVG